MVEACTECGFSPVEPTAVEPEQVPEPVTIGEPLPDAEQQPELGEPVPEPTAEQPRRKRSRVGTLVWIVLLGAGIAGSELGVFDEPTGPEAAEVEGAITLDAFESGVSVSVECPDDAVETEVGDSFECVATTPKGESVTITVRNNEETFEWQGRPWSELLTAPRS
jgi:hypothetical protein